MLKLRVRRLSLDMSQFEVSARSGMSQGRYSMIERGQVRPTIEERARLSEVLQSPPSALFTEFRFSDGGEVVN